MVDKIKHIYFIDTSNKIGVESLKTCCTSTTNQQDKHLNNTRGLKNTIILSKPYRLVVTVWNYYQFLIITSICGISLQRIVLLLAWSQWSSGCHFPCTWVKASSNDAAQLCYKVDFFYKFQSWKRTFSCTVGHHHAHEHSECNFNIQEYRFQIVGNYFSVQCRESLIIFIKSHVVLEMLTF